MALSCIKFIVTLLLRMWKTWKIEISCYVFRWIESFWECPWNWCFLFINLNEQSDAELKRREEEERAQMELREREMFHERLRKQRLESEADSKWLQQEEQNIQLPFSPPPVRYKPDKTDDLSSRHNVDLAKNRPILRSVHHRWLFVQS